MNPLRNSYLYFAYRANDLHDDQPDGVASISIKSCFVALLSRESSTPWKIARNPFFFRLQTLLFVVVLTEEWQQAAEMENRSFKNDGVDAPYRWHPEVRCRNERSACENGRPLWRRSA